MLYEVITRRPDRSEARGHLLPALELAVLGLGERVLHALGRRLPARMLAEKIVLLGGRQSGVAVRRADHAELVGIGAEPCLEREAP